MRQNQNMDQSFRSDRGSPEKMNTSRSRTTKKRNGTYNSPRKVSSRHSERVEREQTTRST